MKTALLLLSVLVAAFSTSHSQEEKLPLHEACLMECFRCVKTYGKQVYNGKLCAENCAQTNGHSIDAKCDSPIKRTANKPIFTSRCVQQCAYKCAAGSQDANGCIFTCVLSGEKFIIC